MTKQEILNQIDNWLTEVQETENTWGTTELASYAYQKVYDFLQYNIEDAGECYGVDCYE